MTTTRNVNPPFGTSHEPLNVDSVAAHYRERNMAAVVFTVDRESQTGHPPISNREIARQAASGCSAWA